MLARIGEVELKSHSRLFLEFFESLKRCFVNRDDVIEALMYALVQRQHLILFGPPGTSKTGVCDVAFAGITGAEKFQMELSLFMSEDAIFGPYDPKKMREEGILEHNVAGMLPTANLARLGEMLDANMALLRSLLSALNERRMRRGKQALDIPLYTVYCDTNIEPGVFLRTHQNAWAVLDRILFMERVDYITEESDMTEMVRRFQQGKTNQTDMQLPFEIIQAISEPVVANPTLITDDLMFRAYGKVAIDYRIERAKLPEEVRAKFVLPEISDRRLAIASQMLEASAVLSGRFEVIPSDLREAYRAVGTTKEEKDLWIRLADAEVEKIAEMRKQNVSDLQATALRRIEEQLGSINPLMTLTERAGVVRELNREFATILPEDPMVRSIKSALEEKLRSANETLREEAADSLELAVK